MNAIAIPAARRARALGDALPQPHGREGRLNIGFVARRWILNAAGQPTRPTGRPRLTCRLT